jgi:hypothetical protein
VLDGFGDEPTPVALDPVDVFDRSAPGVTVTRAVSAMTKSVT